LQYNYSHDNDGAGILICAYNGVRVNSNNIVRYNISQNDARKQSLGAIYFWSAYLGGIQNVQVYNNLVYVTPGAYGGTSAINFQLPMSNVYVRNNIFIAANGAAVTQIAPGQSNVQFQGNDYWSIGAPLAISWNGYTYSDLNSFRASTGEEMLNGSPTGMNIDPLLTSVGNAPTLNNADLLNTLSAYKLLSTSPLINTGLNLAAWFSVNQGSTDFWGNPVPSLGMYSVGANEYTGH
jgi:hypothetical protein